MDARNRPNVYERVYYLAARSYYGQRCGTAVDLSSEFAGFKHAACHLTGAYNQSSGKSGAQKSSHGWHDAGDYRRYVVNSGISTGMLLWTAELFSKEVSHVSLRLPESGNGTPDLLNEVRWNLEWMFTMQDGDGGVWHKQTSTRFSGFVTPVLFRNPRVWRPGSTVKRIAAVNVCGQQLSSGEQPLSRSMPSTFSRTITNCCQRSGQIVRLRGTRLHPWLFGPMPWPGIVTEPPLIRFEVNRLLLPMRLPLGHRETVMERRYKPATIFGDQMRSRRTMVCSR